MAREGPPFVRLQVKDASAGGQAESAWFDAVVR